VALLKRNSPEDRYLVNLVLKGDNSAFNTIIRNSERLVTQIVFKMVRNAEDRKDLAQDIYLRAYKGLASFTFRAALSTWIAQIAYNTCINHLEKKKHVLLSDWEETAGNDTEETDDVLNTPLAPVGKEADQGVLQKQRTAVIQQAIEALPPLYKTLITLYHNEELSYEEITSITDLPIGTVKNYLFRARKTLKEHLLKQYKKEEL
jgi:RNA polymerase sigma-70 factor, ECF subfamily